MGHRAPILLGLSHPRSWWMNGEQGLVRVHSWAAMCPAPLGRASATPHIPMSDTRELVFLKRKLCEGQLVSSSV